MHNVTLTAALTHLDNKYNQKLPTKPIVTLCSCTAVCMDFTERDHDKEFATEMLINVLCLETERKPNTYTECSSVLKCDKGIQELCKNTKALSKSESVENLYHSSVSSSSIFIKD